MTMMSMLIILCLCAHLCSCTDMPQAKLELFKRVRLNLEWPKNVEKRMPQFRAAFDALGTNQDGLLSAEELAVMFDGDVDEAKRALEEAGKDKDGKLSAEEMTDVLDDMAMDDEEFEGFLEEMKKVYMYTHRTCLHTRPHTYLHTGDEQAVTPN